jgi:hypothetical protein
VQVPRRHHDTAAAAEEEAGEDRPIPVDGHLEKKGTYPYCRARANGRTLARGCEVGHAEVFVGPGPRRIWGHVSHVFDECYYKMEGG